MFLKILAECSTRCDRIFFSENYKYVDSNTFTSSQTKSFEFTPSECFTKSDIFVENSLENSRILAQMKYLDFVSDLIKIWSLYRFRFGWCK